MLVGDNDSNLKATTTTKSLNGGDKVRPVKPRVFFEQMTPRFQEVFIKDLVVKYTLTGDSDPEKRARHKIRELNHRPQTHRAWRRQRFFTLQAIDKNRQKLGLKPIHFSA